MSNYGNNQPGYGQNPQYYGSNKPADSQQYGTNASYSNAPQYPPPPQQGSYVPSSSPYDPSAGYPPAPPNVPTDPRRPSAQRSLSSAYQSSGGQASTAMPNPQPLAPSMPYAAHHQLPQPPSIPQPQTNPAYSTSSAHYPSPPGQYISPEYAGRSSYSPPGAVGAVHAQVNYTHGHSSPPNSASVQQPPFYQSGAGSQQALNNYSPAVSSNSWPDPSDSGYSSGMPPLTEQSGSVAITSRGDPHGGAGEYRSNRKHAAAPQQPPAPPKCAIPDCRYPAYYDVAAQEQSEYCGDRHKLEAVSRGLAPRCPVCGVRPQRTDMPYCGKTCKRQAESQQRRY